MSPIVCPRCHAAVEPVGAACPQCGQVLYGVRPTGPQPYPPMQAKSGSGAIIAIVVAVLLVPAIGIFAVLGIYGVRKYIANAKVAEAKVSLGAIALGAQRAYENDRRLCASASAPVPADRNDVRARKYQSTASEWRADEASKAGFACLGFEMHTPQYFQYEYEATRTGFVARAYGDLNGDGVRSTFAVRGTITGDRLVVDPTIEETSPDE